MQDLVESVKQLSIQFTQDQEWKRYIQGDILYNIGDVKCANDMRSFVSDEENNLTLEETQKYFNVVRKAISNIAIARIGNVDEDHLDKISKVEQILNEAGETALVRWTRLAFKKCGVENQKNEYVANLEFACLSFWRSSVERKGKIIFFPSIHIEIAPYLQSVRVVQLFEFNTEELNRILKKYPPEFVYDCTDKIEASEEEEMVESKVVKEPKKKVKKINSNPKPKLTKQNKKGLTSTIEMALKTGDKKNRNKKITIAQRLQISRSSSVKRTDNNVKMHLYSEVTPLWKKEKQLKERISETADHKIDFVTETYLGPIFHISSFESGKKPQKFGSWNVSIETELNEKKLSGESLQVAVKVPVEEVFLGSNEPAIAFREENSNEWKKGVFTTHTQFDQNTFIVTTRLSKLGFIGLFQHSDFHYPYKKWAIQFKKEAISFKLHTNVVELAFIIEDGYFHLDTLTGDEFSKLRSLHLKKMPLRDIIIYLERHGVHIVSNEDIITKHRDTKKDLELEIHAYRMICLNQIDCDSCRMNSTVSADTIVVNINGEPKSISIKPGKRFVGNLGEAVTCPPTLDIVLLLDTSGDLDDVFLQQKNWTVKIVKELPIHNEAVRVSLIQYAETAKTEFNFAKYSERNDIIAHLENMTFVQGNTRTGNALFQADNELFSYESGARQNSNRLVIVFTDGLSIDDPTKAAKILRRKGVQIYAISVNSIGFVPEMLGIVGDADNIFGPMDENRIVNRLLDEVEKARSCDVPVNKKEIPQNEIKITLLPDVKQSLGKEAESLSTISSQRTLKPTISYNSKKIVPTKRQEPLSVVTAFPTLVNMEKAVTLPVNKMLEFKPKKKIRRIIKRRRNVAPNTVDKDHIGDTLPVPVTSSPSRADFRNLHNGESENEISSQGVQCPMDILFVVDSSGSIAGTYETQKEFLTSLLKKIEPTRSHRVGLIQFAGPHLQKMEWSFDSHSKNSQLLTAIRSVRHLTGTTYIGAALELSLILLESRRRNTETTVILVSDGFSQDDSTQQAKLLRQLPNVKMYAVSLTKLTNTKYLTDIVEIMYHMLPLSYKPEIRSSRRQHGAFQNKVAELVDKLLQETEVVDSDHRIGNKFFNAMDTFFSYGLLSADKAYWRCIRQFMPRAEREMLIAECGNANDRFLSIGWLKTALNKGTLHFQMLAMNNNVNKVYLKKFYHVNSCICNSGLLEAVTESIGKLQHIQFAFYTTRHLRPAPAQAIVIDSAVVQLSSRQVARQRRMTETEASSDTIRNIVPPAIPDFNDAIDPDVQLDDIVRKRTNRLQTQRIYDAKKATAEKAIEEEPAEPEIQEKLEDLMVKTMSMAHMEAPTTSNLQDILNDQYEEDIHCYELVEGEFELGQGDVLQLAMNVFEKSSERVIQTFIIFENFHSNEQTARYLVLTNYNIYVFQFVDHTENEDSDNSCTPVLESYIPLLRIPHDRLTTIYVASDSLSFLLTSNEEGFIRYQNGKEQEDVNKCSYWASVASYEAGTRLLHAILNLVEHTSRDVRPEIEVDNMKYMGMFKSNLEAQLRKEINIETTSLNYWYEQQLNDPRLPDCMTGYLYKSDCEVIIEADKRNIFILKTPHGSYEFECMDKEEFSRWESIMTHAIESVDMKLLITPTLTTFFNDEITFVQEGEKFWNDGFLRILHTIKADKIVEAVAVIPTVDEKPFGNVNSAFCIIMSDGVYHYLFLRFPSEVARLQNKFTELYQKPVTLLNKEYSKTNPGKLIYNTCRTVQYPWHI
ncbi:unnamed protein product [Caenorhabditis bovis]|uniref:VWFA domain-containing protein n=1 Tax=Caenorhabditis bovis TaxID=2654633 RepID=A0A8S1EN30_9PELO|nr:unnamed protein product [Caenorhabditis bovis]